MILPRLISALTLFVLLTAVALCPASESRIRALGDNPFLWDDNNLTYCPSLLEKYGDRAFAELGASATGGLDDQWGGVALGLGEFMTVGLFLDRKERNTDNIYLANGFLEPVNPVEILLSTRMESASIGLGFYRAAQSASRKVEQVYAIFPPESVIVSSDISEESGLFGIRAGLSFNIQNRMDMDFWGGAQFYDYSNHSNISRRYFNSTTGYDSIGLSATTEELSGSYCLNLGFRATSSTLFESHQASIFGNLDYAPYTATRESLLVSSELEASLNEITAGLMDAWRYSPNGRLFSALMLSYSASSLTPGVPPDSERTARYSIEETKNLLFPIFRMGLEHSVTPWFTARLGLTKYFGSQTLSEEYRNYSSEQVKALSSARSDFITLGAGFALKGFLLDAVVSKELLYNGSYLISGTPLSNGLIARISLGYSFGRSGAAASPVSRPEETRPAGETQPPALPTSGPGKPATAEPVPDTESSPSDKQAP